MDLKSLSEAFLKIPLLEAGARHSKADVTILQTIHDHALALGAACKADEAMMGYMAAEAARSGSEIRLVESSVCDVLRFREAVSPNPLVKIISPGRGSSGYYSKELLQRDGPAIFKKGTLMFANHATPAEEAARPEGDWEKLVAVTSGNAYWDENGKDGPALYAPVLPMASRAKELAEKAPYTGVSIRAGGRRDDKALGPDGKPGVITALTSAESVDVVTRAGRDGKLLLESASAEIKTEEATMDEAEKKKLQEASAAATAAVATLTETNRKLSQRLARSEARDIVREKLAAVRLPEKLKALMLERICPLAPITVDGELDTAALGTLVEAKIKEAGEDIAALGAGQIVAGMGAADPPKLTEAEQTKSDEARAKEMDRTANRFGNFTKVGRSILNEGRDAFDPSYNAADKEVA